MNFLQVYNDIKEKGGSTYNFFTGAIPESGYIVALKGYEKIVDIPDSFGRFTYLVRTFLTQKVLLELDGNIDNKFLGFWVHNGLLYIDVVVQTDTFLKASRLAAYNNQISFYDVVNKTVIYL